MNSHVDQAFHARGFFGVGPRVDGKNGDTAFQKR